MIGSDTFIISFYTTNVIFVFYIREDDHVIGWNM
jgi:hypothetical protein